MFEFARRLLRDFSFLLKILELIMAVVCLKELSKYSEYLIPRWLWVIYCIDSSTYTIIYFSIAMTHVFEKPRKLPEFMYFSLGVIFNLIGAIAGIERARNRTSVDYEADRSELKIGMLLLANSIVLFSEAAYMAYEKYVNMRKPNVQSSTTVNVNNN